MPRTGWWPLLSCAALALPAAAREPGSQVSLYTPLPGRTLELEQGYARHLRWHLEHRDPWPWYLWQIASGERQGRLWGGAFDRPWAEFDQRPGAADDRADHQRHIDVHLERAESRYVVRRADLGGTLPLLESAPLLALVEVHVRPDARAGFERELRRRTRAARDATPHGWLELLSGGPLPTYLLLAPLAGRAELPRLSLDRLLPEPGLGALVVSVRSELLRFRPDLSTCRLAASGCLGTVPAP